MRDLYGINSGTFAFKDINFLKKIKSLYQNDVTENVMENIMLEQSSFNYALCKELNFNFDKNVLDLTSKTTLFAQNNEFRKEKLIYHFNGFSNEMRSKFNHMKNFYEKKYLNSKN